ncbi:cysteine desulfurase [Caldibacillus lycopersici]|uniref:cysteine desulfurase n=1 Tax=Perspicuibacillus lycopersici TaxID=1325689 RepID=A0AAE3LMW0_9BACI|nr:cysteine desulfurase family protein [Perspicuibacillus lycopersici]MCU9613975.1 cysteine desulfurase [Perspicuibacillus lycopersici]
MEKIYVDHAATSPMHPEVIKVMTDLMPKFYGNPSSIHHFGREARHIVDQARTTAAKSIHADFTEIIFTSGGTEADNLALIGTATANENRGKHIITTQIEHHAVLNTCKFLEKNGFEIEYLPVDQYGIVRMEDLKKALRDDTILVSVMFANNEVGSIQPIAEIGQLLKNHPAYFHTDAVQAYGVIPINVQEMGIDMLSVSAHKLNGPKGIGFLYVKNGTKMTPHLYGGEQERKRRAGTENVPAIAGFAKAISESLRTQTEKINRYKQFKARFIEILTEEAIDFRVHGLAEHTLPHVVNISFTGINVEQMLVNLDLEGIAASSGSACTAGSLEPSHVLRAMFGSDSSELYNSIRFSFGFGNSLEQIETVARKTAKIVKRLTNN